MRGDDQQQDGMFSYISPNKRVPQEHPLRRIRSIVDRVLDQLSPRFNKLYARAGRPSIAPEKLLRALLLQLLYSVRSERLLMEQLDYNLLFRWFVGLSMDAAGWDENNPTVNYRGEKRTNQTHCSTTDPQAMLARKGPGKEAKLSYHGHLMTENRSGLVVNTQVTTAYGSAECHAGLLMAEQLPGCGRVTLGADKGYDQREFVEELRCMGVTPHVAQNQGRRRSRLDQRTTRHPGYEISQRKRKRIEEVFGWMKTVGMLRQLRHRGLERVGWVFTLAAATYNLVRMRTLMPKCV